MIRDFDRAVLTYSCCIYDRFRILWRDVFTFGLNLVIPLKQQGKESQKYDKAEDCIHDLSWSNHTKLWIDILEGRSRRVRLAIIGSEIM